MSNVTTDKKNLGNSFQNGRNFEVATITISPPPFLNKKFEYLNITYVLNLNGIWAINKRCKNYNLQQKRH